MTDAEIQSLRAEVEHIKKKIHDLESKLPQKPEVSDSGSFAVTFRSPEPVTAVPPVNIHKPPVRSELSRMANQATNTPRIDYSKASMSSVSHGTSSGSSKFLGVIAVICFLLAVSFLIKLVWDSGWMTPMRQLSLAGTLGLGLIFSGVLLSRKRDMDDYATFLPAAGVVALYMTVYGGKVYYEAFSDIWAMVLTGGVSVISITLGAYFRSEFYVLLAVFGTYLCPLLLSFRAHDTMDTMMFFLAWDIAFAGLSIILESRLMVLLTAYLSLIVFGITHREANLPNAVFQAVQFFILSGSIVLYSMIKKTSLTFSEAWAYFPLLVLFYGIEYAVVHRIAPGMAPYIALIFSVAIYILYFLTKTYLAEGSTASRSVIVSFSALVFFHAFYLEILPERYAPWFALLLMATMIFLKKLPQIYANFVVLVSIFLIIGINFIRALIAYGENIAPFEWAAINFGFFAALIAGYLAEAGRIKNYSRFGSYTLLACGSAQAMMGLMQVLRTQGWERFYVSVSWGVLALAILLGGKIMRDKVFANSALFVFGTAALKVLLYDTSAMNSLGRIFCLLALGVIFYLGGYLYRHIESWEENTEAHRS